MSVPSAATGSTGPDEQTDPATSELRPQRRRIKRIVLVSLLVPALLAAVGVAGAPMYIHSVDSGIARVDVFQDVPPAARPDPGAKGAMNLLTGTGMVGSQSVVFAGRVRDRALYDALKSDDPAAIHAAAR